MRTSLKPPARLLDLQAPSSWTGTQRDKDRRRADIACVLLRCGYPDRALPVARSIRARALRRSTLCACGETFLARMEQTLAQEIAEEVAGLVRAGDELTAPDGRMTLTFLLDTGHTDRVLGLVHTIQDNSARADCLALMACRLFTSPADRDLALTIADDALRLVSTGDEARAEWLSSVVQVLVGSRGVEKLLAGLRSSTAPRRYLIVAKAIAEGGDVELASKVAEEGLALLDPAADPSVALPLAVVSVAGSDTLSESRLVELFPDPLEYAEILLAIANGSRAVDSSLSARDIAEKALRIAGTIGRSERALGHMADSSNRKGEEVESYIARQEHERRERRACEIVGDALQLSMAKCGALGLTVRVVELMQEYFDLAPIFSYTGLVEECLRHVPYLEIETIASFFLRQLLPESVVDQSEGTMMYSGLSTMAEYDEYGGDSPLLDAQGRRVLGIPDQSPLSQLAYLVLSNATDRSQPFVLLRRAWYASSLNRPPINRSIDRHLDDLIRDGRISAALRLLDEVEARGELRQTVALRLAERLQVDGHLSTAIPFVNDALRNASIAPQSDILAELLGEFDNGVQHAEAAVQDSERLQAGLTVPDRPAIDLKVDEAAQGYFEQAKERGVAAAWAAIALIPADCLGTRGQVKRRFVELAISDMEPWDAIAVVERIELSEYRSMLRALLAARLLEFSVHEANRQARLAIGEGVAVAGLRRKSVVLVSLARRLGGVADEVLRSLALAISDVASDMAEDRYRDQYLYEAVPVLLRIQQDRLAAESCTLIERRELREEAVLMVMTVAPTLENIRVLLAAGSDDVNFFLELLRRGYRRLVEAEGRSALVPVIEEIRRAESWSMS